MTSEPSIIVQLPRDGALDRQLHAYPPPSLASGQAVLDHVLAGPDGRLEPPEAGEIVMSVPSFVVRVAVTPGVVLPVSTIWLV